MKALCTGVSAALLGCLLTILETQELGAQASARAETLAQQRQWQGLLHFDRGGVLSIRRSAVTSPSFFLSDQGRFDPRAELEATLDALHQQMPSPGDPPHAQCRFPARALWLEQKGAYTWQDDIPCETWDDWWLAHRDRQVGLLFATGYLGNPASFFGHLLLLLSHDEGENRAASQLLERSYNFGADVPEQEGMVAYVVKGLLGGYSAQFSNALFFQNAWVYSEMQMRDLWHYRLDLPEFERRLLIAHLYEIEPFRYDYLFLTENCASRIGRMLEIVVDRPIVPTGGLWVAPEAVVKAVAQAEVGGVPLLKSVEHHASRRRRTEALYRALPGNAQAALADLWPTLGQVDPGAPAFLELSPDLRARVLETALSHLRALETAVEAPALAEVARDLLRERVRLPAGSMLEPAVSAVPIHHARPGARISLGAAHSSELGRGVEVGIRLMQYDLLDSDHSRQADASLQLLRVQASRFGAAWDVGRIDLLDIMSLHVDAVPLPLARSTAWRANFGARRADGSCRNCRDWHMTGIAGRSTRLGAGIAYVLAGGVLRTTRHQEGWVAAAMEAGVVGNLAAGHRALLTLRHEDSFRGPGGRTSVVDVEHRVEVKQRFDLRVKANRELHLGAWQVSLGSSWYR